MKRNALVEKAEELDAALCKMGSAMESRHGDFSEAARAFHFSPEAEELIAATIAFRISTSRGKLTNGNSPAQTESNNKILRGIFPAL
ncbi:MAG: hypothetical protein H6853_08795 [Rhodospirillales bacterium]|nr:hypothetical protein [Alphaproteobacteria bacterium]USO03603.1 MAG: hypothetical protein H6853_08795 [Rhodospirillales bacterium]